MLSNSDISDAQATLDTWRECGADRLNPVRFHFMEALARRSASHSGDARRLLNEKLSTLINAYAAEIQGAESAANDACSKTTPTEPVRGPLTELNAYIASQAPEGGIAATATTTERPAYPELWAIDYFRETWSKVSANQQIRQSQKHVPDNAGPLNSNHLVHRSLLLMGKLSPGYLRHFLSYVDGLSWLEQLNTGAAAPGKESVRAGSAKKTTRSKPR